MPEEFITRPPKYENESIEGYLFRLSIINRTPLKYTNIKSMRFYGSEKEIAEYFDSIFKSTGHKYNREHFIYDWYKDHLTLPKWYRSKYTRYCPHCLIDSLFHRYFWCISLSTYCFKHQCYLNENCNYCNKKVDIEETVLGTCKQCNGILSQNNVYSSVFQDKSVIEFCNVPSYFVPFLSSREYINLIKLLSYHLRYNCQKTDKYYFRNWGYLSDVKLQHEINCLAISLLGDWPYKIINYLHNTLGLSSADVIRFLIYFISKVKQLDLRIRLRKKIYHSEMMTDDNGNDQTT